MWLKNTFYYVIKITFKYEKNLLMTTVSAPKEIGGTKSQLLQTQNSIM